MFPPAGPRLFDLAQRNNWRRSVSTRKDRRSENITPALGILRVPWKSRSLCRTTASCLSGVTRSIFDNPEFPMTAARSGSESGQKQEIEKSVRTSYLILADVARYAHPVEIVNDGFTRRNRS